MHRQELHANLRAFVAVVAVIGLVSACGEVACEFPRILQSYCGGGVGGEECGCRDDVGHLEAYVNLLQLPSVLLVESPGDYFDGNAGAYLNCTVGSIAIPTTEYAPDPLDRIAEKPIRARIDSAKIIRITRPGNGVQIVFWELSVHNASQVQYFRVVNDSTEVPITPDWLSTRAGSSVHIAEDLKADSR